MGNTEQFFFQFAGALLLASVASGLPQFNNFGGNAFGRTQFGGNSFGK